MRLNSLLPFATIARLSLVASLGLGLTSCFEKECAEPRHGACGTAATVRLCLGKTLACPTEHTTLELADGTRLRPSGPAWDAYLPRQQDGQVLSIGYTLGATLPAGEVGNVRATVTCLEAAGN
ncbi:hypothetical protein LJY25_07265 [Hymenobacter sp. BT175]|uniref:hypothetical protein n=1 Tax=Hymenobacter translucens TaxID=2886507 RepID=UPI001D0EE6BB|nr:hypothetical protein [Hymenobacter translucens]MCC2546239.1 hypothetical protein [Hymenobacter translucens]